jgi:hypothetical protein
MKIFESVKVGILSSARSWKGILIVWFYSLVIVSLLVLPMKGALRTGLGSSMITEMLKKGINVEVFADLGAWFRSLISYFASGFVIILFAGCVVNAFLTGGLFNSLKRSSGTFSTAEFFRASAKNFWPFLVISMTICLIVLVLSILIIVIPVSLVSNADTTTDGAAFKTGIIAASVFLLILIILLLTADYARAWQVAHNRSSGFKALGFGFSRTFRTFSSSYLLMIILLVIQLLYGWLVLSILPEIEPDSEGGIILLFLLSQLMFIIKIFLKVWRYGSVTGMKDEYNNNQK